MSKMQHTPASKDAARSDSIAGACHTLTPEQATAALNEHGFLLQQAVRNRIEGYSQQAADLGSNWKLEAYEYPVKAPDGSETTIDLLLKRGSTYLCLECKRPNPGYKHWLFFESGPTHPTADNHTFFEASVSCHDGVNLKRTIDRLPPDEAAAFKHFLEVTLSDPGKHGKVSKSREQGTKDKLARTDGLHGALRQAITGTSGVVTKLLATKGVGRAVPVIITTAQLYEGRYSADRIQPETATLAPSGIQLSQRPFVTVQYSAPESLALTALSQHERAVGINDLINAILRTVYIVRIHNINEFLDWAAHNIAKH